MQVSFMWTIYKLLQVDGRWSLCQMSCLDSTIRDWVIQMDEEVEMCVEIGGRRELPDHPCPKCGKTIYKYYNDGWSYGYECATKNCIYYFKI